MIAAASGDPRPDRGPVWVRAVSVVAVLLTACGFDVLANERPVHVLGVALAAAAVGAVRLGLRGRLRRLFVVVNLAVLLQPAAHALATLAHAGAARPTSGHLLPEDISALALQIAITLLVVVVAGSEPLLHVGRTLPVRVLRVLLGLPAVPGPSATGPATTTPADGLVRPALLLVRHRPRRGPPLCARVA